MAIYHLSVKTISRSAGRSATAAAAYRAGEKIADERTGEIHDYTRKGGVESAELVLPENAPDWASDRAALWNAAEQAETRKNSTVAREFEIALPSELPPEERRRLAVDFAREIVARHGCAADVCIHAPSRDGDPFNHHAHILVSTRRLAAAKGFTEKTRELDDQKSGEVNRWRARFAELQNERLQEAGARDRVDHRSLEDQGITDRLPGWHHGPAVTAIIRREESSIVYDEEDRQAYQYYQARAEAQARARAQAEREREREAVEARRRSEAAEFAAAVAAARARKKREQEEQEEARKATEKPVEPKKRPAPAAATPSLDLAAWRARREPDDASPPPAPALGSAPALTEPSPRPEDAERDERRARLYAEWYKNEATPYLQRQYDRGDTRVATTWVDLHERWELDRLSAPEDPEDDAGHGHSPGF